MGDIKNSQNVIQISEVGNDHCLSGAYINIKDRPTFVPWAFFEYNRALIPLCKYYVTNEINGNAIEVLFVVIN